MWVQGMSFSGYACCSKRNSYLRSVGFKSFITLTKRTEKLFTHIPLKGLKDINHVYQETWEGEQTQSHGRKMTVKKVAGAIGWKLTWWNMTEWKEENVGVREHLWRSQVFTTLHFTLQHWECVGGKQAEEVLTVLSSCQSHRAPRFMTQDKNCVGGIQGGDAQTQHYYEQEQCFKKQLYIMSFKHLLGFFLY